MGSRVLQVTSADALVRAYAHCAPSGPGAGVVVLNLSAEETVHVPLPSAGQVAVATAPSLDSQSVSLNGTPLALGSDDGLPSLTGPRASAAVLPPRSWAFITLERHPACAPR